MLNSPTSESMSETPLVITEPPVSAPILAHTPDGRPSQPPAVVGLFLPYGFCHHPRPERARARRAALPRTGRTDARMAVQIAPRHRPGIAPRARCRDRR